MTDLTRFAVKVTAIIVGAIAIVVAFSWGWVRSARYVRNMQREHYTRSVQEWIGETIGEHLSKQFDSSAGKVVVLTDANLHAGWHSPLFVPGCVIDGLRRRLGPSRTLQVVSVRVPNPPITTSELADQADGIISPSDIVVSFVGIPAEVGTGITPRSVRGPRFVAVGWVWDLWNEIEVGRVVLAVSYIAKTGYDWRVMAHGDTPANYVAYQYAFVTRENAGKMADTEFVLERKATAR
jgi:hypothetical protein